MYEIEFSNSFKKDYKLIKKRGYDLSKLHEVFKQLIEKGNVDAEYLPHKLVGNYSGCWEERLVADMGNRQKYKSSETNSNRNTFGFVLVPNC